LLVSHKKEARDACPVASVLTHQSAG
jgi:hypothetical protein